MNITPKEIFEKATTAVSEELDFSLALEKCKKGKGCVAALFHYLKKENIQIQQYQGGFPFHNMKWNIFKERSQETIHKSS